jgi:hypothetical protein
MHANPPAFRSEENYFRIIMPSKNLPFQRGIRRIKINIEAVTAAG